MACDTVLYDGNEFTSLYPKTKAIVNKNEAKRTKKAKRREPPFLLRHSFVLVHWIWPFTFSLSPSLCLSLGSFAPLIFIFVLLSIFLFAYHFISKRRIQYILFFFPFSLRHTLSIVTRMCHRIYLLYAMISRFLYFFIIWLEPSRIKKKCQALGRDTVYEKFEEKNKRKKTNNNKYNKILCLLFVFSKWIPLWLEMLLFQSFFYLNILFIFELSSHRHRQSHNHKNNHHEHNHSMSAYSYFIRFQFLLDYNICSEK